MRSGRLSGLRDEGATTQIVQTATPGDRALRLDRPQSGHRCDIRKGELPLCDVCLRHGLRWRKCLQKPPCFRNSQQIVSFGPQAV
jgi:hypothetical protein